jgi:hypothetical protein
MTSILSSLKQRPSDVQYFTPLTGSATSLNINIFTPDTQTSTTSYVSGAAQGSFTSSNITAAMLNNDASGPQGIPIFRDLGITILSSARTFRGVQLLTVDRNGSSGWTSSTGGTAGVWKASPEGITGSPSTTAADNGFSVVYFETGARGLGLAQGLVRYG